jgi:mitochondrial distribution and morphology protein 31
VRSNFPSCTLTELTSTEGFLARSVSDYLTHETGISVIFESAIVPKWHGNGISFKNVYISRRPREINLPLPPAALGKRAAPRFDMGHGHHYFLEDEEEDPQQHSALRDANYSMFDLNVDSIDVTLSLARWLDGKGLLENVTVRGVRGVLGMCATVRDMLRLEDLQPRQTQHCL